jgi:hypothetical protein
MTSIPAIALRFTSAVIEADVRESAHVQGAIVPMIATRATNK